MTIDFSGFLSVLQSAINSITGIYKSMGLTLGQVTTNLFVVCLVSLCLGMIVQHFFGGDDDE